MAINRVLFAGSLLAALICAAPVSAREAASPTACQAAANTPALVEARSAVDGDPNDLEAHFKLADAWSDAGCFGEAVQVLQSAAAAHAGSKELETRLRVARSLVGEEHFFDNLDRANAEARLKRTSFRCSGLYDLEACGEALRLRPDDPVLLVAQGDALAHAKRPADALSRYRLAAVIAPNQHDVAAKIMMVEGQLPEPARGAAAAATSTASTAAADRADRTARVTASSRPAASTSAAPPLRAANVGAAPGTTPGATRRYSNAAPEGQSH